MAQDIEKSVFKVLVTGAATGFGRMLCEALADKGHQVYAGMRDPEGRHADAVESMHSWSSKRIHPIVPLQLDVTSGTSVREAFEEIRHMAGGVDCVVNNAGVTAVGLGADMPLDHAAKLFETNVLGAQRVNMAALPHMRSQKAGLLVHISSSFGRFVVPGMGLYCASKAALEVIAESFRYELAPLGIDSIIVEPGAFPTGMSARVLTPKFPGSEKKHGTSAGIPQHLQEHFEGLFNSKKPPNPKAVVQTIIDLISMPNGLRPLRTVVDPHSGHAVESFNRASVQAQAQAMASLGLANIPKGPPFKA
ncbi:MAG: SDR family oxidoreductase [Gammaproteobacteria bacterium]